MDKKRKEILAYFVAESKIWQSPSRLGRHLPLPMALPEIDYPQMKYTDENDIPILTLMYIGPFPFTLLSTIQSKFQNFSGYEIVYLKSRLEDIRTFFKISSLKNKNKPYYQEKVKMQSQTEEDLNEALRDMKDELKKLGRMPIPKTEKTSQTPASNEKDSVAEAKSTE